ncbi:MAG: ScpA family protein [Actinomycetaceae bacterium]|nr:ScpA family protein [Actinomycetaceae bacterium]
MATLPETPTDTQPKTNSGFHVNLENFSGPFDLLLGLISQRQLDITEVALAEVTDEFISYMRQEPDLSSTSEFLVVAATLLDMKAHSLLPRSEDEEHEDLEYLETRDLLFSRLLQYRAFKQVAAIFSGLWAAGAHTHPRAVTLEPQFEKVLPTLKWTLTPQELARLAANALSRKPPQVVTTHLHDPLVPVRPQAELILARVKLLGQASFAQLCEDAADLNTVVSRFLAILDLYREGAIEFHQPRPLEELLIRWSGQETKVAQMTIDEEESSPV